MNLKENIFASFVPNGNCRDKPLITWTRYREDVINGVWVSHWRLIKPDGADETRLLEPFSTATGFGCPENRHPLLIDMLVQ